MSVLREILDWSQDRPTWQRDALRRLVLSEELSDSDITALTEICKSGHGLAEQQEAAPLATEHVPNAVSGRLPYRSSQSFITVASMPLPKIRRSSFPPASQSCMATTAQGKQAISVS
jgi:hypothetical protein